MTYLIIFSTVLGVLNLVLVLAVLARLRGGQAGPAPRQIPMPVLPPGAVPGAFTATTPDGDTVDGSGFRLVGFFSPACSLCHERMPALLDYVGRSRLGRHEVLAVLVGAPGEVAELARSAGPVATVVIEEEAEGPAWRAFGLRGLPAFYLLDEHGVILGSGTEPAALPSAELV